MDELRALYMRIENPIDNKIKWNKMLNIYSTSYNYEEFYSGCIKKHKQSDAIKYDSEDKKTFCLIMWSIWKNKVLSISEEELRERIETKKFDYDIYEVISKIKNLDSVKTYTVLQQVLTNSDINRYFSSLFDDFGHKVNIYSDFDIKKDASYNIVFSIKLKPEHLYRALKSYVNECIKREMPYYIKYNEFGDKIIVNIYSNIDNFKNNEIILNLLKKENYSYFYENYDILAGNINEIITVKNRDNFNLYQYTRERSLILYKSFDSITYEYLMNHLNTLVSYKGGRMNIVDYLSTYIMERVVNQLVSHSIRTSQEYFLIANSDDLINLKKYVKEKLAVSMKELLNERLYLRPSDSTIPLTINNNRTIDVEVSIIMSAIRNLVPTLISKDSTIERQYRVRIKNECLYAKVDGEKFCLDENFAKKLFYNKEKYDNYFKEMDKIHNDIKKVESFENLVSNEIDEDTRNKISDSMAELKELFKLEEEN